MGKKSLKAKYNKKNFLPENYPWVIKLISYYYFARFATCHTCFMDRENLLRIRNYLATSDGCFLLNYLQDYITKQACLRREACEIKGMCELVQQIKNIPGEVERQCKK